MKSTGITRRIDDLGRIVIPKEIRKNLRIKENETLEIFIENENIILKKFSSFDDMDNVFERLIEVLEDVTLNNVIITNRERVVKTSKRKEYDYLNKELDSTVIDKLEKKESTLSKGNIELINNKKMETNYYIKPIINNGDVLGSIILFGNREIDTKDTLAVDIISKLIINYTN